jgi:hypothetical protein
VITEEEFRQSLHDHAAPLLADLHPEPGLIEVLRHRQVRRTRVLVAGAGVAVIVVAAGATALAQLVPAGRGGGSLPAVGSAADASPAPAATVGDIPLVSTGNCAGLTVTAAVQTGGWPTWRIAPGGDRNAITVPGGILMYLQASGPCVDALTFRTSGGLLQGPAANSSTTRFNSQGVGVVVTHNVSAGTQDIELWLGCATAPGAAGACNGNPEELAVIPVTVVPRSAGSDNAARPSDASGSAPALQASRSPDPAAPAAAACVGAQLAVDYVGVTFGTGMNFAPLRIRNVASSDCTLTGNVTVVGLDAAGREVTNSQAFPVAPGLVLTAHTQSVAAGAAVPAGVSIAWVPVAATVRDAGGYCANLVVPKTWSVTIAGVATLIANGDGRFPASGAATATAAFGACGGELAQPQGEQVTRLG